MVALGITLALLIITVARWWREYRVGVTASAASLTRGLSWFAVSCLLFSASSAVDSLIGAANFSAMARRIGVGMSWLYGQDFLLSVLQDHGARMSQHIVRSRLVSRIATGVMMLSSVVLWAFALPHDHELVVLNADPSPSVTVALLVSYVWIIAVCAGMVGSGFNAARSFNSDLPGRVFGTLLATAGAVGVLGCSALVVTRLLHPGVAVAADHGLTLPLTAALAFSAALSVPVVEWCQAQRAAREEIAALSTQWRIVTAHAPEVILPLPWYRRMFDAPLMAERMRIELLDAEARQQVDQR